MIVMPAKKKVGTEVEILLPAMARDVRRLRDAETFPQFIDFSPRVYFLNCESGHRDVERCCKVCPKTIAVK